MKRIVSLILAILTCAALCACGGQTTETPAATEKKDGLNTIIYTQYASGGIESQLEAVILFENSNSTFTRYQVAFTSCTCRDAGSN